MNPLASFKTLLGGDWGINQTVGAIRSNVIAALKDPSAILRLQAEFIIGSCPERDEAEEIYALFSWLLLHFRYVHDPLGIEMVKTPVRMADEVQRQGYFQGDCDDATSYLAGLLLSIGYPVSLVVIAPDTSPSFDYQHIYLRAWMTRYQRWTSLDPTARGRPFGWEAPHTREKTWEIRP